MSIADQWTYTGGDECCHFFTSCLHASKPDVKPDARVLEIGCAEFDWLTPASQAWPSMTFDGIDWRCKEPHKDPRVTRVKGDVRDLSRYPAASFDWVVSISAIEHIGLGHYAQDPLDADGDIVAMANAFTWLKPGGWLFADVPYDPTGYKVEGTSHRVYDDQALFERLWVRPLAQARARARWHGTYYTEAGKCGSLTEGKPKTPCNPFYYVGVVAQKVG